MRILVLLHDAFGGRGGIAKFNRDLLFGLTSHPAVREVVCVPRMIVEDEGKLPAKLVWRRNGAKGAMSYIGEELRAVADPAWFDMVICGHLRLMRLMPLTFLRRRVPMGMILHGVDAWDPLGGSFTRAALDRLDWFLSVSQFTADKFLAWSGVDPAKTRVVPNAVDIARFTPGPKNPALLERYKLAGRKVLMGFGRLDQRERYKGFDEVMEAMPVMLQQHPDLAYMICGDGSDRPRLEAKARELGLADRVVFTGYVDEAEKVDHYRLADCFLLAGWGEGFGIVIIEALACGVPSVASNLDASSEAVADGKFGPVVNPKNQADLIRGIEAALASPRVVPAGLDTFSQEAFERRIHQDILGPYVGGRA